MMELLWEVLCFGFFGCCCCFCAVVENLDQNGSSARCAWPSHFRERVFRAGFAVGVFAIVKRHLRPTGIFLCFGPLIRRLLYNCLLQEPASLATFVGAVGASFLVLSLFLFRRKVPAVILAHYGYRLYVGFHLNDGAQEELVGRGAGVEVECVVPSYAYGMSLFRGHICSSIQEDIAKMSQTVCSPRGTMGQAHKSLIHVRDDCQSSVSPLSSS